MKYFEYTVYTKRDYTINILCSFLRTYFGVDFKTYLITNGLEYTVGIMTSADFIEPDTRIKAVLDPRYDNSYKGIFNKRRKRKTKV